MEENKESVMWQKAYAIVKEVQRITDDPGRSDAILRILRERSTTMLMDVTNIMSELHLSKHEQTLCSAYEHAHDTEYLLFMSLLWQTLRDEETSGLVNGIHEIKRDIVVLVASLKS